MGMSTSITSFKIWAITVCLNAFLFGLIELLLGNIWAAMGSVIILITGYIIGLPFWLLMWLLMEVIMAFPYSATGRIAWLAGILAILVALSYAAAGWITTDHFALSEPPLGLLTGTTIAALILALYWNRKAFGQKKTGIGNQNH
jgi:hypothetical protein